MAGFFMKLNTGLKWVKEVQIMVTLPDHFYYFLVQVKYC